MNPFLCTWLAVILLPLFVCGAKAIGGAYSCDEEKVDDANTRLETSSGNAIKPELIETKAALIFSMRRLALAALALMVCSHAIHHRECLIHYNPNTVGESGWRVVSAAGAKIHLTASNNSKLRKTKTLPQGAWCTAPEGLVPVKGSQNSRLHLTSPWRGWVTPVVHSTDGTKATVILKQVNKTVPTCPVASSKVPGSTFKHAPTQAVVAQTLWNAAQVVQLLLLLACYGTANVDGHELIGPMVGVKLVLLPFAVYIASPGAKLFAALSIGLQVCCIWQWRGIPATCIVRLTTSSESASDDIESNHRNDHISGAVGAAAESTGKVVCRLEWIQLLCNLLCSIYNYNASAKTWPHWLEKFNRVDEYLYGEYGHTKYGALQFHNTWYSLGTSATKPDHVPNARGSITGSTLFVVVWSVLPCLYVIYFACIYMLSSSSMQNTRFITAQKLVCIWCIFHFLIWTDVVDYKYGRGLHYPPDAPEYAHWSERMAWRAAIILPVYQKVASKHWLKAGYKWLHYAVAVYTSLFFINQVVLADVVNLPQFILHKPKHSVLQMLQWHIGYTTFPYRVLYGYHSALVTMTIVYGYLWLFSKRPVYITLARGIRTPDQ